LSSFAELVESESHLREREEEWTMIRKEEEDGRSSSRLNK
jgi:hypothetical protein